MSHNSYVIFMSEETKSQIEAVVTIKATLIIKIKVYRCISYVDSNDELNVAETPDVRVEFA